MKTLLLVLLSGCAWAAVCPPANGFSNCQSLTIDHTKVPGNLTNYPALVCFDPSMGTNCLTNSKQLATTAHGGFLQDTTNGFDFVFTSDSGGTMALAYEAKFHNLTTGASELWVNVASVSSTVDTTIYLFYGKVSITTDQSNVAGTWDVNFITVYHFDFLTGANTTVNDSKGNLSLGPGDLANDITTGSMGVGIAGAAGGAVSLFDGMNGGFSDGGKAYASFPTGSTARTIECWTSATTGVLNPPQRGMLSWGGSGVGAGWSLSMYNNSPARYWGVASSATNQAFVGRSATATIDDGLFHHIAATLPSGGTTFADIKVYVDGVTGANDLAVNGTTAINSTSVQLDIGAGVLFSGDWYASGNTYLDECRISNIERTAAWLTTEYNNVHNPSTFFEGSIGTGGTAGRTIIVN